jgi:hypothetical protein
LPFDGQKSDTDQLSELFRQGEFIMDIRSHIDRCHPLNWRLRYRVMLFLVLALVLMPAAIFATSDTFSDVPDGNIFHNAINAIYGARITAGTSPGLYSPNLAVTREQMAAFLQRGLPRVAHNSSPFLELSDMNQDTAVVTINTGGATGGTGFVKLDASISVYTSDTTGCPCEVQFEITRDGGGASSTYFVTVYNNQAGVDGNTSGSITWAVPVLTATAQTFRLQMIKSSGTATVKGAGDITALYVPFGSTGGNTL